MREILGGVVIIYAILSAMDKWQNKDEFPAWEFCTILWVLIALNSN